MSYHVDIGRCRQNRQRQHAQQPTRDGRRHWTQILSQYRVQNPQVRRVPLNRLDKKINSDFESIPAESSLCRLPEDTIHACNESMVIMYFMLVANNYFFQDRPTYLFEATVFNFLPFNVIDSNSCALFIKNFKNGLLTLFCQSQTIF